MAERVTMWKSKNGKVFETGGEAEEEDRAEVLIEVFHTIPYDIHASSLDDIARWLAGEGYRITNINPASA